jgi:hypothetical protein
MRNSALATTEVQTEQEQAHTQPEPSVPQLPHHKVKMKKSLQRSCNEKDEKGKICAGHLKRWYYASDSVEQECGDVEQAYGKNAELYRCEYCKTIYLPNPQEPKTSSVAGRGQKSVFGLTVPPKETK